MRAECSYDFGEASGVVQVTGATLRQNVTAEVTEWTSVQWGDRTSSVPC